MITKEGEKLKRTALQKGIWPSNTNGLLSRHYREYAKFINAIRFDKINTE
jgi:hypothetical protein